MERWGRGYLPVISVAFILVVLGGVACSSSGEQPLECAIGSLPEDTDCDGILNVTDNCPDIPNVSQIDSDQDGLGDLCEIVPCGDGFCDPQGGECDIFDYCTKDCTQSLCLGLAAGETCGDGFCQPLNGECSNFDFCIEDCPEDFFCFPHTCGDGECQPWENNHDEFVTFCFDDCICRIEKPVVDQCHEDIDCQGVPGTVCGPESFPIIGPGETPIDFSQTACICTLCGNSVLDPGEGCDPSAGPLGLEECFSTPGAFCDSTTCECIIQEFECNDGFDSDSDGKTDCEDEDCMFAENCAGGEI